jgi:hypothetical protein
MIEQPQLVKETSQAHEQSEAMYFEIDETLLEQVDAMDATWRHQDAILETIPDDGDWADSKPNIETFNDNAEDHLPPQIPNKIKDILYESYFKGASSSSNKNSSEPSNKKSNPSGEGTGSGESGNKIGNLNFGAHMRLSGESGMPLSKDNEMAIGSIKNDNCLAIPKT